MSVAEAWLFLSAIVALAGAAVVLISMVGVLRLPDVLSRAHAVGKGLTLGLGLLLLSLWMDLGVEVAGLKIAAAILFQFVTLPVASHLLSRLSVEKKLPRVGDQAIDQDPRNPEKET